METRLFVLNLPYRFSESKMRDVLSDCNVTSVVFAPTIYGVLACVELASKTDAAKAQAILDGLKLPAPLGVVRGASRIGQKLGEILLDLTKADRQCIAM